MQGKMFLMWSLGNGTCLILCTIKTLCGSKI
uniref:Uncharacterized protein n=1 Tax=Rhizophora mucronata TaxID=61149 RepID=A0A2P2NAM5_RHIMU